VGKYKKFGSARLECRLPFLGPAHLFDAPHFVDALAAMRSGARFLLDFPE
jgi:hypothetical protein